MLRAKAWLHGLAGAPLTVMFLGSQIVSRRGVITDCDGAPMKGTPLSISARPLLRRLADPEETDVAVGRTISELSDVPVPVPASGSVGQPLIEPASVWQRSVSFGNPS